jgi:hypothetical protein
MPRFSPRICNDITEGDDLLFRLCRDDALARGHKEHLIATMRVHLVPGPRAEVDDTKVEILAGLRRQQRLSSRDHR